jgi:preprotein translocase subunit SecE
MESKNGAEKAAWFIMFIMVIMFVVICSVLAWGFIELILWLTSQ